MTIPSAFKFNNTISNNNVAIETALISAFTDPIPPSLLAALANAISISGAGPYGGRLTFQTATPIITSTITNAISHYWTPYNGQTLPIWNGTKFQLTDMGGELSQLTTDTTKSPAAVIANTAYDIFGWVDTSSIRYATRGPAWSNSGVGTSVRGTGAGTSELQLIQGVYTNKYDIINGPLAGFGTYLGSYLSDNNATLSFILGSAASGGSKGGLYLWNKYNKILYSTAVTDNGALYSYSSNAFRASRASINNSIDIFTGLIENSIFISYFQTLTTQATVAAAGGIAVGINSTTVGSPLVPSGLGQTLVAINASFRITCLGFTEEFLGLNNFQALEASFSGTTQFDVISGSAPAVISTASFL